MEQLLISMYSDYIPSFHVLRLYLLSSWSGFREESKGEELWVLRGREDSH